MDNKIIIAHSSVHWRDRESRFEGCFTSIQAYNIFAEAWKNDPNHGRRYLTKVEVEPNPIYENKPPPYKPPFPLQNDI